MLGEKRLDYEWLPRALKRLSSAEIMALEIGTGDQGTPEN